MEDETIIWTQFPVGHIDAEYPPGLDGDIDRMYIE
jgi:hypothetical protein